MTSRGSVPRTGPRHPAGRGAARTLWGDGFAGDGLAALSRVRSWCEASPDELALLLPRLPLDAAMRHVAEARLRSRLGVATLLAGGGHDAVAAAELGDWFAVRAADDPRAVADLSDALSRVVAGGSQADDPDLACRVAGLTGLHPAYLWPSEGCAPARGAAACWLGWVRRGRRAIVHDLVAEVLGDDACERDDGLAAAAGGPGALAASRRLAASALATGRDHVDPRRAAWRPRWPRRAASSPARA